MSGAPYLSVDEAGDETGARGGPGEDVWEQALDRHRAELLGFASRALSDRGLAEEAVQETFLRALRARAGFDPERGALRAWLFAIQRHVLADLVRSRRVLPAPESALEQALPAGEDALADRWQVEQALRRLSPEHRQVVLEIYYCGRTARDLARRLGVPEGTVRSRLFYALRELREQLEVGGWQS